MIPSDLQQLPKWCIKIWVDFHCPFQPFSSVPSSLSYLKTFVTIEVFIGKRSFYSLLQCFHPTLWVTWVWVEFLYTPPSQRSSQHDSGPCAHRGHSFTTISFPLVSLFSLFISPPPPPSCTDLWDHFPNNQCLPTFLPECLHWGNLDLRICVGGRNPIFTVTSQKSVSCDYSSLDRKSSLTLGTGQTRMNFFQHTHKSCSNCIVLRVCSL